jgi:hypothetical protein
MAKKQPKKKADKLSGQVRKKSFAQVVFEMVGD